MAECGVYTGGTAEIICSAAPTQVLHLFDSFEGMPGSADPHTDYHRPGDFSDTSVDAVRQRLSGRRVSFHVGFMPATFEQTADVTGYSFVHVDVDIYPSVRDCVAWFWPRLAPGGVMVFDDYGFYPYRHAARRAVDEFFADVPEEVWALPTGQGLVLKDY
jgi:O-methyltransferase